MQSAKEKPLKKLSSKIVYQTPWLKVREDTVLRQGREEVYSVVESNDSVFICALNEMSEIFLIHGYSHPAGAWSWMLPGGGGDREEPVVAAERELLEEAGLKASKFEVLGDFLVNYGRLEERSVALLATGLEEVGRLEAADDLDVISGGKFVHIDEVREMVDRGEICDSQSISTLYMLDRWLARQN